MAFFTIVLYKISYEKELWEKNFKKQMATETAQRKLLPCGLEKPEIYFENCFEKLIMWRLIPSNILDDC